MIATIDALRNRYVSALSEAIVALDELAQVTALPTASKLESQHLRAMEIANGAADAEIDRLASNVDEGAGTVINVAGDYIRVGDIEGSENIAIGKDIEQRKG